MTNKEINELVKEVRKKGRSFTDDEKREICLAYPAQKVADSLKVPLQSRWRDGPPKRWYVGRCVSEGVRREAVLDQVREMVNLLVPEHEDKAREIFALIEWPKRAKRWRRTRDGIDEYEFAPDFAPIPTFEKLMGLECATCGGTGVAGFLTARRCFDC